MSEPKLSTGAIRGMILHHATTRLGWTWDETKAALDAWLAAHDAEVRQGVDPEMAMPCADKKAHAAHVWQMSATGFCLCAGVVAEEPHDAFALARAMWDAPINVISWDELNEKADRGEGDYAETRDYWLAAAERGRAAAHAGAETGWLYPCPHWNPHRVTLRSGCTACVAEGIERVPVKQEGAEQ